MNAIRVKTASFDVDAQKSFTPLCPDELPVKGGDQIGAALNFMATFANLRIGSKDAHAANAPWVVDAPDKMLQPTGLKHADLTWVSHCVPGTEGFELLDELPRPLDYDYFVWKGVEPDLHPYGALWHNLDETLSTGVIEYLRSKGIERVIVGGLALDFCVRTTALQLVRAGFAVVLYTPACRGISEEGSLAALAEMANAGILIANNQQELTALAAGLGDDHGKCLRLQQTDCSFAD
ncbi:nicotinamidase [Pseudomonas viridiflava]|uniref:nicotinamidase n=1 Tax=Pseudomonas viridiflava TaxID=33069 RepID=UPI002B1D024E|nr:nicotinamidase [Pseudomonas viridiflava]MEE4232383.1 nicotinamidase [Pseudomonas viridiflava]